MQGLGETHVLKAGLLQRKSKEEGTQFLNMPFEHIGVDMVGPLERSQSVNRFILSVTSVICDYATRYPEAYPLREVTAKQVATANFS